MSEETESMVKTGGEHSSGHGWADGEGLYKGINQPEFTTWVSVSHDRMLVEEERGSPTPLQRGEEVRTLLYIVGRLTVRELTDYSTWVGDKTEMGTLVRE